MNFFCTLKQVIDSGYKVIRTVDELHPHTRAGYLFNQPDVPVGDFFGCMKNGWKWIFPEAELMQPKFFECLSEINPEVIALRDSYTDPFGEEMVNEHLFLLFGDRLVQIFPWSKGYSISEIHENNSWWSSIYACMPEPICSVYYGRLDGMSMTAEMSFSRTSAYGLPAKMVTHVVLEDAVAGGDKNRIVALRAGLEKILDHDAVEVSSDPFRSFRFILDARSINGDALFMQYGSKKKQIFHLNDGDLLNLRIVDDPVLLMDEYVTRVLSFKGGFDFLPYSTPAF